MTLQTPKRLEEITLDDLRKHRWCFYPRDDEDYNCFEHVIPDSHPDFSGETIEVELAEFTFSNGAVSWGLCDGSNSFHIISGGNWHSLWFGVRRPGGSEVTSLRTFLQTNQLEMPVEVKAKWSGRIKIFYGLQFVDDDGEICEIPVAFNE